jgi:predicted O-linked N-acetylglucosamine transferase (SPINDLY family)
MLANPEALYDQACRLWQMGQGDAAIAALDAALRFRPGFVEALYNRGVIGLALHRFEAALADFDRAVQLRPNFEAAWNNRGGVLLTLARFEEAAANFDRLIAIAPRNARAWYNRGTAYLLTGQQERAAADFARTLALMPGHPDAFGCLASTALHLCDFARTAELAPEVERRIRESRDIIATLVVLGYSGDPALQRKASENYLAAILPQPLALLPPRKPVRRGRIRIAYLSGDFHAHATAFLAAELFERHDRGAFELVGISYGADDGGPMRARLAKAFDRFHDVAGRDDGAVAGLLRSLEIDIAIDLKGHTHGARPGILARRPAPVQVAYLGYPGTMGGGEIDYVIADDVVAPFCDAPFFSEKIVHLPGSYQVNDSRRPRPAAAPDRAALGLPDGAFVFCSFNNNWKIRQDMFALWMRLLQAVPGSVLWLLAGNAGAQRHLTASAEAAGIDRARLVFAPRLDLEQHLARYRAADLVLDTLPVCAHTTASDALWMGVPVLTCMGVSFAGRVAASLLKAVGLPELVTNSPEEYERLALALARDPARLVGLKARLAVPSAPLFDAARFTRGLEEAYRRMWDRALAGEPPEAFAVGEGAE